MRGPTVHPISTDTSSIVDEDLENNNNTSYRDNAKVSRFNYIHLITVTAGIILLVICIIVIPIVVTQKRNNEHSTTIATTIATTLATTTVPSTSSAMTYPDQNLSTLHDESLSTSMMLTISQGYTSGRSTKPSALTQTARMNLAESTVSRQYQSRTTDTVKYYLISSLLPNNDLTSTIESDTTNQQST